ncbi:MAG: hypothetical protein H6727_18555 [Myxococcales bacterium]|nr:hypothetical protein [Myxococcales bacterium]
MFSRWKKLLHIVKRFLGSSLGLGALCMVLLFQPACQEKDPTCDIKQDQCADALVCQLNEEGQPVCQAQCDPKAEKPCLEGLTCSIRTDGKRACYPPIVIKGMVTHALDGTPIEGARIHAADETGISVTDVVESDKDGFYTLELPVKRNTDGSLTEGFFTLRVSADGFVRFPQGLRPALPLDIRQAQETKEAYVLENTATSVALIPLPKDQQFKGMIIGKVQVTDENQAPSGVLVVAEGPNGAGGSYNFSDLSGNFVLFNVDDGDWKLVGYKGGIQFKTVTVTIKDGAIVKDVLLTQDSRALSSVSGSINIVNAPGGSMSSVVLVPRSVYNAVFEQGEVPPGLRAPKPPAKPSVTSNFTIDGVPDGRYVVLAAFENDNLVRDPDPNIAGTQIVEIDVPQGGSHQVQLPNSFKITEALAVVSPGADGPEATSATPTLIWKDDSSEDAYQLVVYNALGEEVWRKDDVPRVTGKTTVEVVYAGKPLEPGMYYQFRVASIKRGAPISRTEGLRGVFFLPRK